MKVLVEIPVMPTLSDFRSFVGFPYMHVSEHIKQPEKQVALVNYERRKDIGPDFAQQDKTDQYCDKNHAVVNAV